MWWEHSVFGFFFLVHAKQTAAYTHFAGHHQVAFHKCRWWHHFQLSTTMLLFFSPHASRHAGDILLTVCLSTCPSAASKLQWPSQWPTSGLPRHAPAARHYNTSHHAPATCCHISVPPPSPVPITGALLFIFFLCDFTQKREDKVKLLRLLHQSRSTTWMDHWNQQSTFNNMLLLCLCMYMLTFFLSHC